MVSSTNQPLVAKTSNSTELDVFQVDLNSITTKKHAEFCAYIWEKEKEIFVWLLNKSKDEITEQDYKMMLWNIFDDISIKLNRELLWNIWAKWKLQKWLSFIKKVDNIIEFNIFNNLLEVDRWKKYSVSEILQFSRFIIFWKKASIYNFKELSHLLNNLKTIFLLTSQNENIYSKLRYNEKQSNISYSIGEDPHIPVKVIKLLKKNNINYKETDEYIDKASFSTVKIAEIKLNSWSKLELRSIWHNNFHFCFDFLWQEILDLLELFEKNDISETTDEVVERVLEIINLDRNYQESTNMDKIFDSEIYLELDRNNKARKKAFLHYIYKDLWKIENNEYINTNFYLSDDRIAELVKRLKWLDQLKRLSDYILNSTLTIRWKVNNNVKEYKDNSAIIVLFILLLNKLWKIQYIEELNELIQLSWYGKNENHFFNIVKKYDVELYREYNEIKNNYIASNSTNNQRTEKKENNQKTKEKLETKAENIKNHILDGEFDKIDFKELWYADKKFINILKSYLLWVNKMNDRKKTLRLISVFNTDEYLTKELFWIKSKDFLSFDIENRMKYDEKYFKILEEIIETWFLNYDFLALEIDDLFELWAIINISDFVLEKLQKQIIATNFKYEIRSNKAFQYKNNDVYILYNFYKKIEKKLIDLPYTLIISNSNTTFDIEFDTDNYPKIKTLEIWTSYIRKILKWEETTKKLNYENHLFSREFNKLIS